jgi:hypothetical protein
MEWLCSCFINCICLYMLWNSWCCRLLGTPGADMWPGVRSLFTWLEYFAFSIIFSLSLSNPGGCHRKKGRGCWIAQFEFSTYHGPCYGKEKRLFPFQIVRPLCHVCVATKWWHSFPRQMKEKTKIKSPEKSPALWIVLFLVFQTCHSSLKPKIKNKKILPRLNETTWFKFQSPPSLCLSWSELNLLPYSFSKSTREEDVITTFISTAA